MLGFKSILIYEESQKDFDILKTVERQFIVQVGDLIVEAVTSKDQFLIVKDKFWSNPEFVSLDRNDFIKQIKKSSTSILYQLFCFTNNSEIPKNSTKYIIENANYEKLKIKTQSNFKLREPEVIQETFLRMKNHRVPLVVIINFFAAFDIFINAGIRCVAPYSTSDGKIKCLKTTAAMENLLCDYDPNIHEKFTGIYMKFIQPSYISVTSFKSMYDSIKNKPQNIPVRFFMSYKGTSQFPDETRLDIVLAPVYFYSVTFNKDDDSIVEQEKDIKGLYLYEQKIGVNYKIFTCPNDRFDKLKLDCHYYSCFFDYNSEMELLIKKINSCRCNNKVKMHGSILKAFNLRPTAIDASKMSKLDNLDLTRIDTNGFSYELIISLLRLANGHKLLTKINDKEKFKDYLDNNEGGFHFFRNCLNAVKDYIKQYKTELVLMRDAAHEFAIEKTANEKYFKAETAKEYILFLQELIN